MAGPHTLARVVSVAATVSGGAVLTLEGKTATTQAGLEIVRPLIRLAARTVTNHTAPDDATVERVERYLARLVRRYGTLRRALEALAVGRRRHMLIAGEDAAGWVEAMSVTEGAIDATLRRHARLLHALSDFVEEMGGEIDAGLRAYENWLDGDLTEFEDASQGDRGASGGGLGGGSFGGSGRRRLVATEEERARARELARAAMSQEAAAGEALEGIPMESGGGADGLGLRGGRDADMEWAVHGAEAEGAMHSVPEGLVEDGAFVWRTLFDEKPMVDLPGERVLSPGHVEAAERLSRSPDAFLRAIGAVAVRDFGKADSFLPHLDAHVEAETVAMLRGHRYELEGRFDEAVAQYREAHPDLEHPAGRRAIAGALLRAKSGSRPARFGEAIRLLRGLLKDLDSDTVDAARVRAQLGFALTESPAGSKADNLREAIGLFERALTLITREDYPVWWAELNYLLGSALLHCPKSPRGVAVPKAIASLEDALKVWTRAGSPSLWAAVQYLLGTAHERNPNGDHRENLEHAIGCYTAALSVRRRESSPVAWARLQNALGSAWMAFPEGDLHQNCERAIAALAGALEIWARESRRAEWAGTQTQLGTAWTIMPARSSDEREENLERAIRCFRAALEVRTPEACPDDWASTQHNLGNAVLNLAQVRGPGEINGALVKESIQCFKRAHSVRTPDHAPLDWARTAAAMGAAYGVLPIKDRNASLTRATRFLTQALGVFEKVGDDRHAGHVRRLLDGVRAQLQSDDSGVMLLDTDEAGVPRRERKLGLRRGDGSEG